MTTEDFIIDPFCRVDDRMKNVPNHSQALLWPSEPVTIGMLFAVKGRRPAGVLPLAAPGISNHRRIVGGKLCLARNHPGQTVGWAWATANAHDTGFHPLVEAFKDRCVMLADTGFHNKKIRHQMADSFQSHLAMAAFNLLIAWDGLKPRRGDGFIPLSIAQFNL